MLDRQAHAPGAKLFHLAGEFGRGDFLHFADVAGAVDKGGKVLEDVGHSHVLLLKMRVRVLSGAGGHAAGKVGKVAVGDALLEGQVFQRRHGGVVVVDHAPAFFEGA